MIQGLYGYLPRFMSPCLTTSFRKRMRLALVAGNLALLGLCGCGPKRIRADYRNYEAAYASTSNKELLLNLARLENHDPAYFFKLGQITSSYRMQGTISGNGQLSSASGAVQIPTGGGIPGVTWENDPTFQFIPVNDDTNARLLLEPIPAETFDALYQQGWRIDQLFRLLVDRIEITRPQLIGPDGKASNDCEVETIRNLPPSAIANPRAQDLDELSSYVTFLRVSALVYDLQRQGHLVLGGTETFKPYNKDAVIPAGQGKDAGPPPSDVENTGKRDKAGDSDGGPPAAKDMEAAVEKNNVWKLTPSGWVLGHNVFSPVFYLTPMTPLSTTQDGASVTTWVADTDQIKKDLRVSAVVSGPALDNAMVVLKNGFSIETQESQQEVETDVCPSSSGASPTVGGTPKMSAKLILRSLIAVMAGAAQEQKAFDELESVDPTIPDSKFDPSQPGTTADTTDPEKNHFKGEVPRVEQIPLLTLTWKDRGQLAESPLAEVSYRGRDYMIADPNDPASPQNQYWNRDMFRLINALTSQVTVDISKFPIPEILQLHSD
jgi:hypothetical protein